MEGGPSRRAVLVGTVGVAAGLTSGALTGCSVFGGGKPAQPTASASPDLAALARDGAVQSERALLAAYDATIARHPSLAGRLAPIRADHANHLDTLAPADASASPSDSPGPVTPVTPEPPPVPEDAKAALAALVEAERGAAAERIGDLGPLPGRLAQLLASIGGSEAMHAALLGAAQ